MKFPVIKKLLLSFCLIASVSLFAQDKVSDSDLDTFAEVYKAMLTENQQAQNSIFASIEEEGFDMERFSQVEASVNNQEHDGVEPTADELAKHKKIHQNIEKIQGDFEVKMESVIKTHGWTMEQYEKIANAISTDQELQGKLQQKMMGE